MREIPGFVQGDLFLACTIGDEETVRSVIAADRSAVNRVSNPWRCPGCKQNLGRLPLVAVAHTTLLRLPEFHERLLRCARLLLDAGADPNQSWKEGESDHPQSALYGAAGKNHDAALTRMLLDAGANPNDGESLYHALETPDKTCVRLLLEGGARVEGMNALHHQLDMEDIEGLRLLLAYTRDPNDSSSLLGSPLIWAIRRQRSAAHVKALLDAGADPHVVTKDGISAYRFALQSGLGDIAALLRQAGVDEALSIEEEFVGACARADGPEARRILTIHPDIFERLSEPQLRQLPNLTESGNHEAVRLMVELGWPITAQGGDWKATALNLAVYQGNPTLTRFLLEHGASWKERHGHDGDVRGTLWWACVHRDPSEGDWAGCARALVEHGMPIPNSSERYSPEVAAYFASARAGNTANLT